MDDVSLISVTWDNRHAVMFDDIWCSYTWCSLCILNDDKKLTVQKYTNMIITIISKVLITWNASCYFDINLKSFQATANAMRNAFYL
jgi:hypothetical protein